MMQTSSDADKSTSHVANISGQEYGTPMPVEKWSDTVVVAHLADDPQFSEEMLTIEELIFGAGKDVVVDLSEVHFLNSSNLARLLKLRKQIKTTDHKLMLCSISKQVWETFVVTGLDHVFAVMTNVPTALASLQLG